MKEQARVPRHRVHAMSLRTAASPHDGADNTTVRRTWLARTLDRLGQRDTAAPLGSDGLIKAELFSIERLEQFAEDLAATQSVTFIIPTTGGWRGACRPISYPCAMSYHACLRAIREELTVTPAADWLVNNFHLIEEQVRDIRVDLPPAFHRRLPRLTGEPFTGYPRIFAIAWDFIAHTDSEFDAPMMSGFCRHTSAHLHSQSVKSGLFRSHCGSYWSKTCAGLSDDIVKYQTVRRQANAIADRLLGAGNREAGIGRNRPGYG